MSSATRSILLKVRRRARPEAKPYWEEFELANRPNLNVIVCLKQIQEQPVNRRGEKVTPVAWESNCLEEVCGVCSMVINGRPRQACTALVDKLRQPITLEPMSSFPVIRDLVVDRSRMFDALKQIRGWIPIDGTYDLGPGPRVSPRDQEVAYKLSTCMTCGCCLEACPQVHPLNSFLGPAAISQVRYFGLHPTGKHRQEERLAGISGTGGIQECGNAQNCVRVCPKEIPLTDSIAVANRALSRTGVFGLLRR